MKNEFIVAPHIRRACKLLSGMGLPIHCVGFQYILCAVLSVEEDPKRLQLVTKWLYPDAAKRCGTTPAALERGIRQAVEKAWINDPSLFCTALNIDFERKPTNAQFISALYAFYMNIETP